MVQVTLYMDVCLADQTVRLLDKLLSTEQNHKQEQ